MYQVNFSSFSCSSVVVVGRLTLEQAVHFALDLHQASNVPHVVAVINSKDDIIVKFILTEDPDDKCN